VGASNLAALIVRSFGLPLRTTLFAQIPIPSWYH
jgi:hypothetical protein